MKKVNFYLMGFEIGFFLDQGLSLTLDSELQEGTFWPPNDL